MWFQINIIITWPLGFLSWNHPICTHTWIETNIIIITNVHTYMVLNHNIFTNMHTHVVSNHTVSINVHTHMKETNQAGPDHGSWLGFNKQPSNDVHTQHHTHNRMSAMPAEDVSS